MSIAFVSLRWDILGDSVRETALAEKYKKKYSTNIVYYPCGSTVNALLHNHTIIVPLHNKALNNINKKISQWRKLYYMLIAVIVIIRKLPSVESIVYTGSHNIIRKRLVQLIAVIKNAHYKEESFDSAIGFSSSLCVSTTFSLYDELSIFYDKKIITICTESTDPLRCYWWKEYGRLIEKLSGKYEVILLGIDTYQWKRIEEIEPAIHNFVGKLSIQETTQYIAKSDLFIGNDSWLAHIAAAVKTDCIIITIQPTITKEKVFNDSLISQVVITQKPTTQQLLDNVKDLIWRKK